MKLLTICLIYVHLTFTCSSLYTHRSVAHKSVTFHPWVENFFKIWLWLTAEVSNKYRTAYHRVHHAHADQPLDPHSPIIGGKFNMLFKKPCMKFIGFFASLFNKPQQYEDKLDLTPFLDDKEDSVLSTPFFKKVGFVSFILLNVLIFGWYGLIVWFCTAVVMLVSAYTINDGVAHLYGYTNYNLPNNSKNYFPIGIIFGGEELHNNHHGNSKSANYAVKWYEFDIGYKYIQLLQFMGLAKINS